MITNKKQLAIITIISGILFSTCTNIYFDTPQPVDSKNLKTIPNKLRGTWIQIQGTISIKKTTYKSVEWHFESVAKSDIDTNKNLLIKGNRIYDLESDSLIGYSFINKEDSILLKIPDYFTFTLGNSALLRKVARNIYSLNLNYEKKYWEVFLIETQNKNSILIKYPTKNDLKLLESMHPNRDIEIKNPAKMDSSYKLWSVSLTKKEFQEFINLGGFSDTTMVLEAENKVN